MHLFSLTLIEVCFSGIAASVLLHFWSISDLHSISAALSGWKICWNIHRRGWVPLQHSWLEIKVSQPQHFKKYKWTKASQQHSYRPQHPFTHTVTRELNTKVCTWNILLHIKKLLLNLRKNTANCCWRENFGDIWMNIKRCTNIASNWIKTTLYFIRYKTDKNYTRLKLMRLGIALCKRNAI